MLGVRVPYFEKPNDRKGCVLWSCPLSPLFGVRPEPKANAGFPWRQTQMESGCHAKSAKPKPLVGFGSSTLPLPKSFYTVDPVGPPYRAGPEEISQIAGSRLLMSLNTNHHKATVLFVEESLFGGPYSFDTSLLRVVQASPFACEGQLALWDPRWRCLLFIEGS